MTSDPFSFVKGMFVGGGIATVIWILVVALMIEMHHEEAIRHGAGKYNETTGIFEWKAVRHESIGKSLLR